eukprot:6117565-Prymnesium_polylepis.1
MHTTHSRPAFLRGPWSGLCVPVCRSGSIYSWVCSRDSERLRCGGPIVRVGRANRLKKLQRRVDRSVGRGRIPQPVG